MWAIFVSSSLKSRFVIKTRPINVAGPRGFEPRTPGISRFMKALRGPVL